MTFDRSNLCRPILVAVAMLVLAGARPAGAAEKCDPLFADGASLESVRSRVDVACPCSAYDGTEGAGRAEFKRCVSDEIARNIASLDLRKACKGTLKKMYVASVCGLGNSELAPCVEETPSGKVRCKIRTATDCQERSGDVCLARPTCLDGGDTNGDFLVNADDSGRCIPAFPTTTTTSSTTSTTSSTSTTSTTVTTSTTLPVFCGDGGPDINIVVRSNDDEEVVREDCGNQNRSGGGCALEGIVDGSADMLIRFDARGTTDGRVCSQEDAAVTYKWEIFAPTTLQGASMFAPWIRGYDSPVLEIPPSSLPALAHTIAGQDQYYRVVLTVTPIPLEGEEITPAPTFLWFRFLYQWTEMTLDCYDDSIHADADVCNLCGFYEHFCDDAWVP